MNENRLLRTLKTRARLIAAVLILAGGLWAIVYQTQQQQQRVLVRLFGDTPCRDHEIARMELALASRGKVDYVCRDHTILVPKHERSAYIQAIKEENALPAAWSSGMETTPAANPFMSRTQQQLLERTARERELRQLVMQLPFVEEVYLEFDRAPGERLFQPELLTAVVMVKPSRPEPLGLEQVVTVRQLIAGAIAGMTEDRVVVTDIHAGIAYADPIDEGGRLRIESVRYRVNRQKQILNQVRHALSDWPEIEIDVSVELGSVRSLGPGKIAATDSQYPSVDRRTAERRTAAKIGHEKIGQADLRTGTAPAKRPIQQNRIPAVAERTSRQASTNLANGTASIDEPSDVVVRQASHEAVVETLPNRTATNEKELTAATPVNSRTSNDQTEEGERVRITIRVPRSAITTRMPNLRSRATDPVVVEREFNRLKPDLLRRVKAALPQDAREAEPMIAVVLKPDASMEAASTSFWNQFQRNVSAQWPLIAVVLIGVLAVAFLRPSGAAAVDPNEPPIPDYPRHDEEDSEIKRKLSTLIDQDPDAAASVLKQWLRDAG